MEIHGLKLDPQFGKDRKIDLLLSVKEHAYIIKDKREDASTPIAMKSLLDGSFLELHLLIRS